VTFLDSIKFWIAQEVAGLLFTLGVLALIVLIALLVGWSGRK
jgi:hypothetical protein